MYHIHEIEIGRKFHHEFFISDELHDKFKLLSGDDSPIHTDTAFCLKNGFEKPIGYAFLITTLLSRIYGTMFPGGSELCIEQSAQFRKPFFCGDTLFFELSVTQKNDSLKLITVETKVHRQDHSLVFKGTGILQLSLGASP